MSDSTYDLSQLIDSLRANTDSAAAALNAIIGNTNPAYKFVTAQATVAGSSVVWTPAAGKKFRLLGYQITAPANTLQAVAGTLTVKLKDGAADIGLSYVLYVPSTFVFAGDSMLWNSGLVYLGCTGITSSTVNNPLTITLSSALTSGQIRVLVLGTEI